MPHWKVVKNLTLLGQDVIPRMPRAPLASAALPLNKQGTRRYSMARPDPFAGSNNNSYYQWREDCHFRLFRT